MKQRGQSWQKWALKLPLHGVNWPQEPGTLLAAGILTPQGQKGPLFVTLKQECLPPLGRTRGLMLFCTTLEAAGGEPAGTPPG